MLNKVIDFISGNLHKDSRSSSPARSPKGLQTIQGASANVQDTELPHAASSAAPYEQQQPAAAATPALLPNGAASMADVDGTSTSPTTSNDHQQEQQQQQPTDVTATNGTTDNFAANGARSMPPMPPVPPLAPGAMVRSSSAGSSSSRRASLLSDAGRASSRSSLQQQLTESFTEQGEQQQQQPARPNISQLPLHLLAGSTDPSVPPSVALQQANSPDHTPQQEQPAPQPFWLSSNWSFGSHCEQNQRVHMEDRFFAADLTGDAAFASARRAGLFAVFDGHSGHEAAEYLEAHLQTYILAAGPEALAARPLEVLSDAVQRAEREIVASFLEGRGSETAGSTLCAVLLVDDKLHVVHVGDSRAVLGRGSEPIQLTRDHKPACRIEAARIEVDDPEADISPDGYIYGELAVARAIGSAAWKRDPSKRALIPTPDLVSVQLQPEDDFVLLATDGLWDTLSNGEAVTVTRRSLSRDRSAVTAAKALVTRAQGLKATDNITVVALLLHGRGVAMPKSNSMLFNRRALPASFNADADSPPGCSTPCSGASTPASGATPRCCTPNRGASLTSTASAPAAAVAAAAAAAAAGVSPQRSLPQQLPPYLQQ